MKRCPACRARITQPLETCERCGCDLSMLVCIEKQVDTLFQQAILALRNDRVAEAENIVRRLNHLKCSPLALVLYEWLQQNVAFPPAG